MKTSSMSVEQERIDEIEREESDVVDLKNVEDFSEAEKTPSEAFAISSYGADYTVDSLVARLRKEDFFTPPFQRAYVWSIKQASRFIESLLMGLPVPGVFVFRESATNRHLIIDGQQRLKSLHHFYDGTFPKDDKVFRLVDVNEIWEGKTYKELTDSDKRRLDDSIIHTTIFRQESPRENDDSVYEVFERINTGGMKLSPQEIRVCVNFGPITNLLGHLNRDQKWRAIYGPESPRLKDQEMILRFFAFYHRSNEYKRPLRSFLNRYMEDHKQLIASRADELETLFTSMITKIFDTLGNRAFRPEKALNTAVFDAVSVAIARRIQRGEVAPTDLKSAYERLLSDPNFQSTYSRATADEENVKERFKLATQAFEKI